MIAASMATYIEMARPCVSVAVARGRKERRRHATKAAANCTSARSTSRPAICTSRCAVQPGALGGRLPCSCTRTCARSSSASVAVVGGHASHARPRASCCTAPSSTRMTTSRTACCTGGRDGHGHGHRAWSRRSPRPRPSHRDVVVVHAAVAACVVVVVHASVGVVEVRRHMVHLLVLLHLLRRLLLLLMVHHHVPSATCAMAVPVRVPVAVMHHVLLLRPRHHWRRACRRACTARRVWWCRPAARGCRPRPCAGTSTAACAGAGAAGCSWSGRSAAIRSRRGPRHRRRHKGARCR